MAIPPILAAKAPPASSYKQQIAAARYQPHGSFSPAGLPPSAPSHAYVQAPSAPPIIRSQAPSASSYSQQQAAGAYQPHGSFSPAGIPPAQQQAPVDHLAQVLAATRTANPWETPGVKAAVTGEILSTWMALRAKGLFPATAAPPKIIFDNHETPGAGAYVVKGIGSMRSELHVPPIFAKSLTQTTNSSLANWGRDVIVHELAHTAQNAGSHQSKSMAEGGAQTFAQNVAPDAFKNTYVPLSQGAYGQYVAQVQSREPNDWVMHGQFAPGASPPPVNMPGSQAFESAMGGVGGAAGNAAELMAVRSNYLGQPINLPIGRPGGARVGDIGAIPGGLASAIGYRVKPSRGPIA